MIEVKELEKSFITYERGNTLREVIGSVFSRKEKKIDTLKKISFHVDEGELVGFLGPNGAGKSTTIKILTGILYPTAGCVNVMGYTPWLKRKQYVGKIGAVFGQKSQLVFDIPPLDAFYLNKAVYSIPDKQFKNNLDMMVEILGAQNVIKKPTRLLSLGERMKCEFIIAMLHNPKVVFLDEPTIGLDIVAKESIRKFIKEMNKIGVTFILTTHDLVDVEHLAKRIIVINGGEIVFDDEMQSLKSYFGAKKIVKLATEGVLPELSMDGVCVTNRISENEAELELDYNIFSLNSFVEYIGRHTRINDLSIQELPIEKAIIDLYKHGREKNDSIVEADA